MLLLFRHGQSPAQAIDSGRWALAGPTTGFDTWTAPSGQLLDLEGHVVKCRTPQNSGRAIADWIAAENVIWIDPGKARLLRQPHRPAVVIDELRRSVADANTRRRLQMGHVASKFFGQKRIIGIEQRDVAAASLPNAAVACARQSTIFLPNNAEPGVARHELGSDFGALVRRRVIDNDNFEVAKRLAEDCLHRIEQ